MMLLPWVGDEPISFTVHREKQSGAKCWKLREACSRTSVVVDPSQAVDPRCSCGVDL